MNLADLTLLYDFNYWANQRIVDSTAKVSPEQFVATADSYSGSLRSKLVHILDTEYGWREILQHGRETPVLPETDFADAGAIALRWRADESAMRTYLAGLTDTQLNSVIERKPEESERYRPLWHYLFHVVNHGTQHRSEAAALLTEYGQSPGELDFTAFLRAQS